MVRGEAAVNKVHYKGEEDDFLVFVDDVSEYQKWKTDKSVPLANFMGSFKVFVTHKQGAEGNYDGASKSTMHSEFGTDNEDEVIAKILEGGSLQGVKGDARQGDRNINAGPRIAH